MAKETFVNAIVSNHGLTKAEAEKVWETIQGVIVSELKADRPVAIKGLGNLKPTVRKARSGRNPQTGEKIQIPEKKTVAVGLGKAWNE